MQIIVLFTGVHYTKTLFFEISVNTIFNMNSLRLIVLTVAFFVMTTLAVPTAHNRVSGACQKNLIKNPCISCHDNCSSINNNTLNKWTTNITNVLFSKEGMEVFEKFLTACNLTESAERLYLWKKSNAILPYEFRQNNQTDRETTRKVVEQINHSLFMFKDGKAVPFPKDKLYYIHMLQTSIREVLTNDLELFKKKLLNDKKAVDKHSAYLCRNKM